MTYAERQNFEEKALNTPRALRLQVPGALWLLIVATGCFHYVPVQPSAVQAGEEVQVRISEGAAARLLPEFGGAVGSLEGQLAEEGPDSVSLTLLISRDYRGTSLNQIRQTMFLGRSEVIEVRRRQLSRARTVLATAGIAAGFVILVKSVLLEGDPNPLPDDPPPPPPFRGGIRIPLRWEVP